MEEDSCNSCPQSASCWHKSLRGCSLAPDCHRHTADFDRFFPLQAQLLPHPELPAGTSLLPGDFTSSHRLIYSSPDTRAAVPRTKGSPCCGCIHSTSRALIQNRASKEEQDKWHWSGTVCGQQEPWPANCPFHPLAPLHFHVYSPLNPPNSSAPLLVPPQ